MSMACPACGHDNILGVDACEQCGQSLTDAHQAVGPDEGIFSRSLNSFGLRQPHCVGLETTVAEVISLLKGQNVGCILVVGAAGELAGIFTERDVLNRVAGLIKDTSALKIESLMTPRPSTLRPQASLRHALHLMALHGLRHVPVVDGQDRPVGFIAYRDIMRFIERTFSPQASA